MVGGSLAAALMMAASAAVPKQTAEPDCRAQLTPTRPAQTAATRKVAAIDVARLRDFGRQDNGLGGPATFNVSPDGRSAALVIRRGDPGTDSYCMGVLVVPLDHAGPPRLVDVGGDPILAVSDVRGIPDLPIGNLEPVTPHWSPDGTQVAYLRRDGGRTQVWVARADGSGARLVSAAVGEDVRDVRWEPDGRGVWIATRSATAAARAALAAEERRGFLYDDRFWTLSRSRPSAERPRDLAQVRVHVATGAILDGGPKPQPAGSGRPPGAIAFAANGSGARAWTVARDPKVVMGPSTLKVEAAGKTWSCARDGCRDVGSLWWGKGGDLFILQSPTPENGGRTRLLRWRIGHESAPTLLLSTDDALFDCAPASKALVCARETSSHPRHLVRVDPGNGRIDRLYDPNPDFTGLVKGPVRRLRWQLDKGVSSFGDLVLPPGHRDGDQHPLVVVQYTSRGFLRGGTGDEYPVFAFASRGFAVLSVERTRPVGAGVATDGAELMRMGTEGFAERRRVLRSLEAGVAAAIATGTVDRDRIGITGLSDGAATVQHALINSKLFKAAAISSCCDEPGSSMFAAGPGYADFLVAAGFPPPGSDGASFWRQYSLAANATQIRTPILMQLTEDEFRFGLETYGTLKAADVPVEMYVFADEYHQKWRPSHRLATYERAIDWFDFWLNGRSDPGTEKQVQYVRWRALARRQPD